MMMNLDEILHLFVSRYIDLFCLYFVFKGTCVDKVNSFGCICLPGFNGIRCEVNINECLQVSCGNGKLITQDFALTPMNNIDVDFRKVSRFQNTTFFGSVNAKLKKRIA